jgi:hypothetical protein
VHRATLDPKRSGSGSASRPSWKTSDSSAAWTELPSGCIARRLAGWPNYADAVYEASYSVTPSGYAQQSVITQLIKSHREQVNRYLMHFGLSPAARGRVQASNYVQPTLPGIDPKPEAPASGFARFAVVR